MLSGLQRPKLGGAATELSLQARPVGQCRIRNLLKPLRIKLLNAAGRRRAVKGSPAVAYREV
jgi:hypothetical protein